jgi:hypothetical protein
MRDGGILTLYALQNVGAPGSMTEEMLVETGTAFYAYRTAGVTRRYQAKGASAEFDFVVRCFNTAELPEGTRYCVLDDGVTQYQIDIAEPLADENAVDLTLIRVEDLYEVLTE